MLRLDWNLLWTVINILIIFGIVKKFLLKPVNRILAARQEEINKQYAEADSAKENAREMENRAKASLENMEETRARILNEARGKAGEEYERIVTDARAEAGKLLEDARALADKENQERIRKEQEQIADLVVAATAKLVASKSSEEENREIYNQFIAKTGGLERQA